MSQRHCGGCGCMGALARPHLGAPGMASPALQGAGTGVQVGTSLPLSSSTAFQESPAYCLTWLLAGSWQAHTQEGQVVLGV